MRVSFFPFLVTLFVIRLLLFLASLVELQVPLLSSMPVQTAWKAFEKAASVIAANQETPFQLRFALLFDSIAIFNLITQKTRQ